MSVEVDIRPEQSLISDSIYRKILVASLIAAVISVFAAYAVGYPIIVGVFSLGMQGISTIFLHFKKVIPSRLVYCLHVPFNIALPTFFIDPSIVGLLALAPIGGVWPFLLFSQRHHKKEITFVFIFAFLISFLTYVYSLGPFHPPAVHPEYFWIIDIYLSSIAFLLVGVGAFAFSHFTGKAHAKVEEQRNNIAQILGNIQEGIFTISKPGSIDPDTSSWMHQFFHNPTLTYSDLFRILFEQSTLDRDSFAKIQAVIESINDSSLNYEFNSNALPKQYFIKIDNSDKFIEIDWSIVETDKKIAKIIFVLRDISKAKSLEEQVKQSEEESEILVNMMTAEPDCASFLTRSLQSLKNLDRSPDIQSTLNVLHTLKGNAFSLRLKVLGNDLHNIESQFKDTIASANDFEKPLQEISRKFEKYLKVSERFLNNHSPDPASNLTITELLKNEISFTTEFCRERKRKEIAFLIDSRVQIGIKTQDRCRDILGHCVRNTLAHAEASEMIFIAATEKDSLIQIFYWDDGLGLKLDAIEKKGLELGLLKANSSDLEIAQIIWNSGFSTTSDNVMEIAGRGVGMNAIRSLALESGGNIDLVFTSERTPEGYRPFRIVISLLKV